MKTVIFEKMSGYRNKARDLIALAVIDILVPVDAQAQGFVNTATNFTSLFGAVGTAIIAGSVVAGLGAMGVGISQMIKKGGDRGDDITWMSIGLKVFGGALLMVLGWLAGTAVETVGGSRGSIGASYK